MQPLNKRVGLNGTTIASAVAALPFPPVRAADIADEANSTTVVPQFDGEVTSDAVTAFTDLELVGGIPKDQVLSDDDVDTVDFANNELDLTTHAYEHGDGPIQLTTSDTAPTGLAVATNYWVIKTNAGTIQLAASRALAYAGTAVTFSDVGAGTHTLVDIPGTTKRINWSSHGLLGQASDGVVALTATKGKSFRLNHRSRVELYGLVGTPSAGNVSAELFPVQDQ